MQNQKSAIGLDGNVTALIGYIVWIVALVLIFIEKENKFVRFHAFQSMLFGVLVIVLFVALSILNTVLYLVSSTLGGLFSLIFILLWLAVLGGVILLAFKSFKGEMFKFPIIGDLAEKWSS
jgi:uncharacterized membrane protein